MNKRLLVIVLVAAAVGLAVGIGACSNGSQAQGLVNVDADKVQELIAGSNAPRIVDVRTQGEFEAGHLKGAENVPVDQVQSVAGSWDRSQALLVYCATGARSATAVQQLKSMGFETIYHFNQGIVSWQGDLDSGAAQPVATGPSIKTDGRPVVYEFFTEW